MVNSKPKSRKQAKEILGKNLLNRAEHKTHRQPIMLDDGVPYERLGEEFRAEVIVLMQEYGSHSSMTWIAASPFQLVQFKQIIRILWKICGPGGTYFLDGLGLESLEDLEELNGIAAPTLLDLLGKAITSIPYELRDRLGMELRPELAP